MEKLKKLLELKKKKPSKVVKVLKQNIDTIADGIDETLIKLVTNEAIEDVVDEFIVELEFDKEIRSEFVTTNFERGQGDLTKSYDLSLKPMSENIYRIKVQPNETLGHYSDWLITKIRGIRRLNSLSYKSFIRVGDLLDLPITDDQVADFNSKRIEYHQMIEEDFYDNFRVVGFEEYTVKRGDTAERICDRNDITIWLLRKYQEENKELKLFVGQKLIIPLIDSKN